MNLMQPVPMAGCSKLVLMMVRCTCACALEAASSKAATVNQALARTLTGPGFTVRISRTGAGLVPLKPMTAPHPR
ncbi:MAG TPA: hypothetical protein VGD21_06320 [Lysobacter sp.]